MTKIVTIVAGWDTVTNPDSGALGRSREPDSEYLARITESYAINALGSLEPFRRIWQSLTACLTAWC